MVQRLTWIIFVRRKWTALFVVQQLYDLEVSYLLRLSLPAWVMGQKVMQRTRKIQGPEKCCLEGSDAHPGCGLGGPTGRPKRPDLKFEVFFSVSVNK